MKILVLYPHPVESDGVSLQGHYLIKGLRELGAEVMPCDRGNSLEKIHAYKSFNPDVVIGIGFWGDIPEIVHSPINHGLKVVPWFNADGWVANYHNTLNTLPLLIATSNWVKQTYMRDGVKGDNIQVGHIGYDTSVFYPQQNEENKKKLRQMLGIGDDEIMIFTAGGDVTSKGAQEMFKALSKIDDQFTRWKYVLKTYESASADGHREEEDSLVKELELDKDRVIYLQGKYSPEFMASLLNACDIYAAPSRLEGFGMIQVEAMACGKPVISINVGGPKDTIIHGETGYLVDSESEVKLDSEWAYDWMGFEDKHKIVFDKPKTFAYRANTDQLAAYTYRLMTDASLRQQMGKKAAEHASKNFNYKTTAKNIYDLIEKYVVKK